MSNCVTCVCGYVSRVRGEYVYVWLVHVCMKNTCVCGARECECCVCEYVC